MLTATGGAVLHADGSVSTWDEKTPNMAPKHDWAAVSIASSENELFILNRQNGLVRLRDSNLLAEGLKAIFSDSKPGRLLALSLENEALELEIASNTRRSLGKLSGDVKRLVRQPDNTFWAVLTSGELLRHDGQTFASTPQRALDIQSGSGWTLTLEETDRCTLQGEKIPDSPQRFRLPQDAKNIRAGPQGRFVAW